MPSTRQPPSRRQRHGQRDDTTPTPQDSARRVVAAFHRSLRGTRNLNTILRAEKNPLAVLYQQNNTGEMTSHFYEEREKQPVFYMKDVDWALVFALWMQEPPPDDPLTPDRILEKVGEHPTLERYLVTVLQEVAELGDILPSEQRYRVALALAIAEKATITPFPVEVPSYV